MANSTNQQKDVPVSEFNIWTTDDPIRIGHLPPEAIQAMSDFRKCISETNQRDNRSEYLWAVSTGKFSQAQVIADAWLARYGDMYGGLVASLLDMAARVFEVKVFDFDLKGSPSCLVETPTPFGLLFVAIEVDSEGSSASVSFNQYPLTGVAIEAQRNLLIAMRYEITDTVRLPSGQDTSQSESVPTP